MRTRWISRLIRGYGTLFAASGLGAYPGDPADRDADARRMRTDLEAIRVRFPDHA